MLNIIKSIIFGIVEGITEWLPISSTGHMILLNAVCKLNVRPSFLAMYLVVIQLGAILAVVVLYWRKLWPLRRRRTTKDPEGQLALDRETLAMWLKIIVATIPAAVIGVPFDDFFESLFYNYWTVAAMLILFGIAFILIENHNRGARPAKTDIAQFTYRDAVIIGLFQLIAAVFPGTSRSGATIVGALLIGISRTAAAEFTFFLAIPAMFGGSLLKLLKFHHFAGGELGILLVGMIVAFAVSIIAIRFLMRYIKQHDFKAFGWYRIVLGIIVLGFFLIAG
jgi:undecaprenyl-diphosphatase